MALSHFEFVTLFVPDIDAARAFYEKVFAVDMVHADDVSAVFGFAGTMINLLLDSQAPELVAPIKPGGNGPRMLLTIRVDDVDAECARLGEQGVFLLNGPVNRPWGRRTAAFADPAGHVWELAQVLPEPR
ncbi:VOC family protein [Devosia chinhatensis]|uniref:Glyoxalase n=1 Tax=Devosia chinhatensis TaxID=429727 RepID=A0A0F5FLJ2_9HYPH|nr:VOC family protein [Devosia chinhatensis]KKB09668.1 glyoxalase [Devosia chinhatensis]